MKVKNLVVGAGLSGAVLAERIATELGEEVLVLDEKNHIGGNCYDYLDANGIHIHKYGPHIFHTNIENVWDYLSKFTEWHVFMLRVNAVLDGIETNLPFNLDSLYKVFPRSLAEKLEGKLLTHFSYNTSVPILELLKIDDPDLAFLANYVYEKVFLNYTIKQWGVTPKDLDKSVSGRVPILISKDSRYFQDKYQGIPAKGYTKMIERILDHPLIQVKLNTKFEKSQTDIEYERLFFTGPIDEYYRYSFGELPYRSLNFKVTEYNQEYYQNSVVISYPDNYKFTRITEHKHFLNEKSKKTVISYEYPEKFIMGKNERYYPIPNPDNQKQYETYLSEAKKEPNSYFFGRLGDYKYYNMDACVERALNLFEELK